MKDIYIGVPEKKGWKMSPQEFAKTLTQRWPGAELTWDHDPQNPVAFWFSLPGSHGEVSGTFHKSGDFLAFDRTDVRDIGPLAVWFRSLVPSEQPLLLCSGSGVGYSDLLPTDTAEEIARRFD